MPEARPCWALLTGEYPPAEGGVADYTEQLAHALAAAGDEVHVLAPAPTAAAADGVRVHALAGRFGWRARRQAEEVLRSLPSARIVVQYVPHAYGWRAMNLGFARWLAGRHTPRPWVMFHEVAVRAEAGATRRRRLLAATTQRMARQLAMAAERNLVSTPGWAEWLAALAPEARRGEWLPVPSNLPMAEPGTAAEVRARLTPPEGWLIASFGRFELPQRQRLGWSLRALLERHTRAAAVLIGGGGEAMRAIVLRNAPALAPRLHASGRLGAAAAAAHLAASDLVLQPYPDGVSGRRGTAMAALAQGVCLLTDAGESTEPVWRASEAVALASEGEWLATAEALLEDAPRRRRLGDAGRRLYVEQFALPHTVRRLREGRT
jgi:glycosyltransferase involved in cell wall biosynthesis